MKRTGYVCLGTLLYNVKTPQISNNMNITCFLPLNVRSLERSKSTHLLISNGTILSASTLTQNTKISVGFLLWGHDRQGRTHLWLQRRHVLGYVFTWCAHRSSIQCIGNVQEEESLHDLTSQSHYTGMWDWIFQDVEKQLFADGRTAGCLYSSICGNLKPVSKVDQSAPVAKDNINFIDKHSIRFS